MTVALKGTSIPSIPPFFNLKILYRSASVRSELSKSLNGSLLLIKIVVSTDILLELFSGEIVNSGGSTSGE